MTAYHGGKQRIGKELSRIILEKSLEISKSRDLELRGYCEPFCGMLGVYQWIPQEMKSDTFSLLAGDSNRSLILMWKKAQTGWKPPTTPISKEEFLRLKTNGKSSAEKGFIGHFYGYMGKYFQPFRHQTCNIDRVVEKISKMGISLKNVDFSSGTYDQYSKLKNHIIYCDPPYEKQAHYYDENGEHLEKFDYTSFWNWCRKMGERNIVFVSEYQAPNDFKAVWKGNSRTPGSEGKEKLFVERKYLE